MRTAPALLLFLFATAALAQTADLEMVLPQAATTRVLIGTKRYIVLFEVKNNGPSMTDIRVHADADPRWLNAGLYGGVCNSADCVVSFVPAGSSAQFSFVADAPATPATLPIHVAASAAIPDPNPANNDLTINVDIVDAPNLFVTLSTADHYNPEGRGHLDAAIGNSGTQTATGVVLTIDLPDGSKAISRSGGDNFDCDLAGTRITCRAASLAPPQSAATIIRFTFINPPLYDGGFPIATAHLTANETNASMSGLDARVGWYIPKFLSVTTAADSGPGSLRDTILLANDVCQKSCVVGIRIPPPSSGFVTIAPQSPLPMATFIGTIDATAEADLLNIDFATPVVMLDGSQQPSGDGLTVFGTFVQGFAIGNFPRFGAFGERVTLVDDYLGIDPTGHTAAPNFRGVVGKGVNVRHCVVSGNHRSGVVSTTSLLVTDSRIGIAADSDAPMPNGASGIWVPEPQTTTVQNSVIAYNHEFGLALHPAQHTVMLENNSIFGNAVGIDYGLDGRTQNVEDDSQRTPNFPIVADAVYDPATNKTMITIRLTSKPVRPLLPVSQMWFSSISADVFANDDAPATAQAQHFLGSTTGTLAVNGDLRGRTITAITRRTRTDCYYDNCTSLFEASEISEAVMVR